MNKALLALLVLATTGCASAVNRHQVLQANIEKPINCATANSDIVKLEMEKASTQERLANGFASVLPTSIVFNLLAGEFSSRRAIATGKFNNMLYMRIDEIKMACDDPMLANNDLASNS